MTYFNEKAQHPSGDQKRRAILEISTDFVGWSGEDTPHLECFQNAGMGSCPEAHGATLRKCESESGPVLPLGEL